jgi:hypothetical protein
LKILLSAPPKSVDANGLKWLGEEVDRAQIVQEGGNEGTFGGN